ncbi:MAG TPA: LON peptidase substrate-binding domain-containing protein [Thermoleophilia bacterium]|nr:LON peptidase substrate-binding domain-containing protein [Thermoleophilia bacterium]
MPSSDDVIGLFPLPLALLPGEILPLHIFEERYKALIGDCRAAGDVFGVVFTDDDEMAAKGCTAAVHEVIEELDDGRLNILVEGRDRFSVDELIAPADPEAEYLRASVTLYDDLDGAVAPQQIAEDLAQTLFRRMVALMGVDEPRVPRGERPLSFRLASAVDFGQPLKQRLLESRSEAERLDLLIAVMKALIPGLELRKQREQAIRGNGKGY